MDFRDEIYFLFLTVEQEAASESFEGQLAVAYVAMNRAKASGASVIDTVLRGLQFSCWNADSPTRVKIDNTPNNILEQCYKAGVAAYFGLLPDPTHGADHYLNEEAVKKSRDGKLPGWFDEANVTIRIGRHTFLKVE